MFYNYAFYRDFQVYYSYVNEMVESLDYINGIRYCMSKFGTVHNRWSSKPCLLSSSYIEFGSSIHRATKSIGIPTCQNIEYSLLRELLRIVTCITFVSDLSIIFVIIFLKKKKRKVISLKKAGK